MSGVNWHGDRRAQINIAQTQNKVAGIKDNFFYILDAGETVHAPNKLEIAWAPRRIGSHGLHIFLNGQQSRFILPGERHMDDAGWNFHLIGERQVVFGGQQKVKQFVQMELPAVKVDLQRSNSGGQINDPGKLTALQPLHQGVDTKTEIQIQNQRTVLYQDVRVARSSVNDTGPVPAGCEFGEDGFVAGICAQLRNKCRNCRQGS